MIKVMQLSKGNAMGLYRYMPEPSGRMGLLWSLGTIKDIAILEFGSMGHMIYAYKWVSQGGMDDRAKLYSTHIDEKDISLGIYQRVFMALDNIIKEQNPKAIFLLPSTIPEIIGMDLEAICDEYINLGCETPIIVLKKGGFKEKVHHGMEEAMFQLVKNFTKELPKSKEMTYNIIGSLVDVARFEGDLREIKRILKRSLDMELLTALPSHSTIDEIELMSSAHINLVIRKEGLKVAKEMERRYGIPYIYGRPYGYKGTTKWIEEIALILRRNINDSFIEDEIQEGMYSINFIKQMLNYSKKRDTLYLGGNHDVVKGILEFAQTEIGMEIGHAWCDNKVYGSDDIPYYKEEQWHSIIKEKKPGIYMLPKPAMDAMGLESSYTLNRGHNSYLFQKYEHPFVGYRGAMTLCALWLDKILV